MTRPRGRPTKFDPVKAERILSGLSEGVFLTDAAAFVGVDASTVHRWIELGERSSREPYAQFARDVAAARAQFIIMALRKIDKGEDQTRGLRWRLERLRPRQYGEKVRVHVEAEHDAALDRLKAALPAKVYAQVLAVFAGEPGDGEPLP